MTESICVSFRTGCYRRARGVRVRPVPEVGACYVYTPSRPRLYTLNMTAWLILELSEGRSPRSLVRAYRAEIERAYWRSIDGNYFVAPPPPSPAALRRELSATLRGLEASGIIELKKQPRGAQHAKKP